MNDVKLLKRMERAKKKVDHDHSLKLVLQALIDSVLEDHFPWCKLHSHERDNGRCTCQYAQPPE